MRRFNAGICCKYEKKLFPDFSISSLGFGYSVKQIKRPVKVYKDSIFYIFLTRI